MGGMPSQETSASATGQTNRKPPCGLAYVFLSSSDKPAIKSWRNTLSPASPKSLVSCGSMIPPSSQKYTCRPPARNIGTVARRDASKCGSRIKSGRIARPEKRQRLQLVSEFPRGGDNQGGLLNIWNKWDWRFCSPMAMRVSECFARWGIKVRSPSDLFQHSVQAPFFRQFNNLPCPPGQSGLLFRSSWTSLMSSHFLTEVLLHGQNMAGTRCEGAFQ